MPLVLLLLSIVSYPKFQNVMNLKQDAITVPSQPKHFTTNNLSPKYQNDF